MSAGERLAKRGWRGWEELWIVARAGSRRLLCFGARASIGRSRKYELDKAVEVVSYGPLLFEL